MRTAWVFTTPWSRPLVVPVLQCFISRLRLISVRMWSGRRAPAGCPRSSVLGVQGIPHNGYQPVLGLYCESAGSNKLLGQFQCAVRLPPLSLSWIRTSPCIQVRIS
ncbi:hypothetical protein SS50377_25178 [Spironucleus salmonicida]|uniref:Uncharacterized protein n=1 Tax=Spironucleus salmonicida TaxID=348837 RepID=A0A9P8LRU7_9EUKA|nr:hypothetical protein SS50377_25178 [Spironucleus salmonicida]